MTTDFGHLIVTGLLMVAVVLGLRFAGLLDGASRLKRGLLAGTVLLIVLVLFNLIWPYGQPPWGSPG
jgi:hypothetical protein